MNNLPPVKSTLSTYFRSLPVSHKLCESIDPFLLHYSLEDAEGLPKAALSCHDADADEANRSQDF